MGHLLALVSSEKLNKLNNLVSELVIGCYFYLQS